MNETVLLISVTESGNGLSKKLTEKSRAVFCTEKSVGQREFFEALGKGLKAEYQLEIWSQNYNKESYAEYKGNRYKIYRTFKGEDDMLEIYLASEG